jgi:hypothetical protein
VLSERLRLQLGGHDLLLDAGEAAVFDTRVPLALSNPGPGRVEIQLFGAKANACTSAPAPLAGDRPSPCA